jgi:hypothetical protein
MIKKLLCATLALGSSVGLLLAADAFTGGWQLDIARSTFASDYTVPKEATLTFTEQGANRIQVLTRVAADGSATSTEWNAPLSGGVVTFPAGQGPNGGASLRVADNRTLVMTQNLPQGKAGASRTYQVSADGETLTLTIVREDRQERARMVFSRR